jgi:hypothetical protein
MHTFLHTLRHAHFVHSFLCTLLKHYMLVMMYCGTAVHVHCLLVVFAGPEQCNELLRVCTAVYCFGQQVDAAYVMTAVRCTESRRCTASVRSAASVWCTAAYVYCLQVGTCCCACRTSSTMSCRCFMPCSDVYCCTCVLPSSSKLLLYLQNQQHNALLVC